MKYLPICFFLLALNHHAAAQTLDEIVAKHLAATGGAMLDSVKTATMEANVVFRNAPTLKNTMSYTIVHLHAHRIDMQMPQGTATICINDNTGWSVAKMMGQTQKNSMDAAEVQELRYQTDLTGPLHRYQEKGYAVQFLGLDSVGNKPAYKIQVAFPPSTTYTCFIDTSTFFELKRVVKAPSRGRMLDIEFYFAEYKWVNGVLRPYTIEMHNAKGVTVFEYTQYHINPKVDQSLFALPD